MARRKDIVIEGAKFTLQSVSPTWYYNFNDECSLGNGKRDSVKFLDGLIRNCVISPAEVASKGLGYFDEKDDIRTAEMLFKSIESFLREGRQPRASEKESAAK